MSRRKVPTTVYLSDEQDKALRALSASTRVPVAVYVREGIDMALARHSASEEPLPSHEGPVPGEETPPLRREALGRELAKMRKEKDPCAQCQSREWDLRFKDVSCDVCPTPSSVTP